jgi:DNA helicase HerA-like ATPase
VLGSTGSGKSTTVASLLQSIAGAIGEDTTFPSARILLLDVHGEYSSALKDVAKVFAVGTVADAEPLYIPFWAMDVGAIVEFLMGKVDEKALTAVYDKILASKVALATAGQIAGANPNSLTLSSPLPYSLHQLWLDLIEPELKTTTDNANQIPALVMAGDANTLTAPKYQPHAAAGGTPFLNKVGVLSIRRQLSQLRSRLLDRQFDFMLHPGDWEPKLDCSTDKDLDELLESWVGHDRPITILDLSGVPSFVLDRLIGGILNVIYEGLFWGRELPEGGRQRPQLIVMEEAHRYLGREDSGLAREMVQRIVKEGRKFGVGAMIVSQRPSEIDETILSQCGTFFALRLSNGSDRAKVQAALADTMSGIVDSLPVLRTGEAIVIGEAARLPIRCRITLPAENRRPDSGDPDVTAGWRRDWKKGDYKNLAAVWRAQDPHWKPPEKG